MTTFPLREGMTVRYHAGEGEYVDAVVGKVEERSPGFFNVQLDREPEHEPISPFLDSVSSEHWRKFRADNSLPPAGPVDEVDALADLIERHFMVRSQAEHLARVVRVALTSEPALAAFREAWHQADAEGATGDRVRRGMVAAIEAVS